MKSETHRGRFKAATCVDPAGETFFALFKSTQASQDRLELPSWTCLHFGDYSSTLQFVLQEATSQDCGTPTHDGHVGHSHLDTERLLVWRSALTRATVLPHQRVVVPASTGVDMRAVAEVLHEHGLKMRKTAWLEFETRLPGHAKAMAECLRRHQKTRLQPWLCFSISDADLLDESSLPSRSLRTRPRTRICSRS